MCVLGGWASFVEVCWLVLARWASCVCFCWLIVDGVWFLFGF